MTPIRIQRSRQHKQPVPAIYVGRPGVYGNPFKIVGDMIYGDAGHLRTILSPWIYIDPANNQHINWQQPLPNIVIELYRYWLTGMDRNYIRPVPPPEVFAKLSGHNLSCWCKIGAPCHGDVLIELTCSPR